MLIVNSQYFIPIVLEQVNVVVVVTILMIPMQNYVFLILLKNLNIKVFNLMSMIIEKRHIEQHETCKCKCGLDPSACNNKQRWNEDKCRCECNELIDKGVCDKGFIWNPSNCECDCDKSCDIGEYLDY